MQTDMHYYATYSLARAAGFRNDIAKAIATAAEYVDDSDRLDVTTTDGFHIVAEPTAHHPTNMKDNTDPTDQKRTWVPFHFVPGNEGSTLEEKLLCRTDSAIARAVVENALNNLDKEFGVLLLGILAHAYVDTFSHYGFSGISSRHNEIDPASVETRCSKTTEQSLETRWSKFFARYAIGPFANSLVKLGHGAVATYPDQPFLIWEFMYTDPRRPSGVRENPKTFLAGCRSLHNVFVRARAKFNGDHDDNSAFREFKDIETAIKAILAVEGDADARTEAWQTAMQSGFISRTKEAIPEYDSSRFTNDLQRLDKEDEKFAKRSVVFAFLQAAAFYRDYILNDLLPKNGIHVESAKVEWYQKDNA
jgi:hypothetical protein